MNSEQFLKFNDRASLRGQCNEDVSVNNQAGNFDHDRTYYRHHSLLAQSTILLAQFELFPFLFVSPVQSVPLFFQCNVRKIQRTLQLHCAVSTVHEVYHSLLKLKKWRSDSTQLHCMAQQLNARRNRPTMMASFNGHQWAQSPG